MKKITLVLLSTLITIVGFTQSILQPGRIYKSGETLSAPRFGFTGTVPEGWEGMLPRESEVFLLTTTTSTYGEIYIFGRDQSDLTSMQAAWNNGFELSETVSIKATNSKIENGLLMAEVVAQGNYINKQFKGFIISRCSNNQACITALMVSPEQFYQPIKEMVLKFMQASSFNPPSNESPYQNFNWKEFLNNKMIMSYTSVQAGSKETIVHLCADGTFNGAIKQSGLFKNEEKGYRGNNSGTWTTEGVGENCSVKFIFKKKKLPPLEVPFLLIDEKVFSNGERFFVGQSDKCK